MKSLKDHQERVKNYEKYINELENINDLPENSKSIYIQEFFKIINEMKKEKLKYNKNIELKELKLLENIDPKLLFKPIPYSIYPGSDKGIFPEDDPKNFEKWIQNTETPIEKEMKKNYQKHFQNNDQDKQLNNFELKPSDYFTDEFDRSDFSKDDNFEGIISKIGKYVYKSEEADDGMEAMPENLPPDWQQTMPYIERWTNLRILRLFKKLDSFVEDNSPKDHEFSEIYYPTLYSYYETLPEFMRNSPVVKSTLRGLEKYKGHWDLQDKLDLINKACKSSLDVEPWVEDIVPEFYNDYRFYPTAEQRIRMMANAGCLVDENGENQSKNVELIIDKLDYELDNPRVVYEDGNTVLDTEFDTPLNYYDNDDGYWDEFINQKNEIRSKVPRINTRKYFKH